MEPRAASFVIASVVSAAAVFSACRADPVPQDAGAPASAAPIASVAPDADAPDAPVDAFLDASPRDLDPMALQATTDEELLALVPLDDRKHRRIGDPKIFLDKTFGVSGPSRANQGNPAIAHHFISRAACMAGLAGVTLQTPEQRELCGDENMVPIWRKGKKPKACIDVFEYPNRACELPMVWVAPVQANILCELQGKRLCQQEEWILACRGDPEGEKDSMYAYGEELDLEACNTNKPQATNGGRECDDDSARTAWNTCPTNTEPSGAFPRCRSRFGVFDQHGNVAEAMTRRDPDGTTYDQLKGSAFFYTDVSRKATERQKDGGRETYPDHCAHDPRWHVEPMDEAWHVNYHLGFRCCKTLR